jgi:hypothetical protein
MANALRCEAFHVEATPLLGEAIYARGARCNAPLPHTIEIDPQALTLAMRDPELFDEAESIADSIGVGYTSRTADRLIVRCAGVEDLALLGDLLAYRAN